MDTYMIDIKTLKATLELRWLTNGFIKLAEPEDVEDYLYTGLAISEDTSDDDFDFLYWEPALIALEKAMVLEEGKSFYRVAVFYEDGNLVIASTRGSHLDVHGSE
jgi:hypothetical protein